MRYSLRDLNLEVFKMFEITNVSQLKLVAGGEQEFIDENIVSPDCQLIFKSIMLVVTVPLLAGAAISPNPIILVPFAACFGIASSFRIYENFDKYLYGNFCFKDLPGL